MDTTSNQEKDTGTPGTDQSKTTEAKTPTSSKTGGQSSTAAKRKKAAATTAASAAGRKSENDMEQENQQMKPAETDKEGPLFQFFTDMLKDMYYAEKHILEALPKMQKAATTEELQEAFEDHHLQTQKQISRLEKVFRMIGEQAEGKKCDAIIGIVKEGEKCIEETEDGSMTRDAALIIAAQKVEHYEIASYGGLCALAETLGLYDASEVLHATLEEETRTDRDLTHIAESFINFYASEDDSDEDDQWDEDEDYDDYDDDFDGDYDRSGRSHQSYH